MIDLFRTQSLVPDTSIFKFYETPKNQNKKDADEPLCMTDENRTKVEEMPKEQPALKRA